MKQIILQFQDDTSLEALLIAMKEAENIPFVEYVYYDFNHSYKVEKKSLS